MGKDREGRRDGGREGERERGREGGRETETETERDRDRDRERDTITHDSIVARHCIMYITFIYHLLMYFYLLCIVY